MAERAESPTGTSRKQQVSRRAQKLSEERLARKRELDRQAQRSARVKTKNHIAHLESRIEALTKVQGSGDIRGLIEQIEKQRKENEALKTTLKTIGKLVGNTGGNGAVIEMKAEIEDEKTFPATSHDSPDTDDTTHDRSEQIHNGLLDLGGPSNSSDMILSTNGVALGLSQPDLLSNTYPETLFPDSKAKSFPFFGLEINHAKLGEFGFNIPTAETLVHTQALFGHAPTHSDWRANPSECCCRTILVGNELLSSCSKLRLQNTANQRQRDEDIAIRAALHGWNAVTERYALDPVWQTIRHADAAMFSKCFSLAERLVCLNGVCVQLRSRVTPTSQNLELLPYFARERPSQRAIPHYPLIDYLVWPGLRERLVFNPHCYCSDKFESMFWPCFRFVWEHEFRNMYIFNRQTGLYQFTPIFLERIRDLKSFRMTPKFFTVFPEFRADIDVALPEPEPNNLGFGRDLGGFGSAAPQEMEPLHNGFVDGDGFSQLDWSGSQANMRVGEVGGSMD